jgi:hypothetical protein
MKAEEMDNNQLKSNYEKHCKVYDFSEAVVFSDLLIESQSKEIEELKEDLKIKNDIIKSRDAEIKAKIWPFDHPENTQLKERIKEQQQIINRPCSDCGCG